MSENVELEEEDGHTTGSSDALWTILKLMERNS